MRADAPTTSTVDPDGPPEVGRRLPPHRLLGVPPIIDDPVEVILAAHLKLRRLRTNLLDDTRAESLQQARRIMQAREALLTQITRARFGADAGPRGA